MKDKEKQINRTDNFEELSDTVSIPNKEKTISISKFEDIKLTIPCKNKMREKQIEKMAKLIEDRLIEANNYLGSMNKGEGYWIAQKLVEHYQPKLPEDSVVLSREEYELYDVVKKGYPNDMTCLVEKFTEISHNSYTKGSKETAEKYSDKLVAIIQHLFDIGQIDFKAKIEFLKENEKIAKQFGVEIKE